MSGPRLRGWRSLLWSKRPHAQGLLLPADSSRFLYSWHVFEERAGGPSKGDTVRDVPRQDWAKGPWFSRS